MSEMKIQKFDETTLPSEPLAEEMARFFERNYPGQFMKEFMAATLESHADAAAIATLIRASARIFLIATDISDRIIGLLEMREIDITKSNPDDKRLLVQLVWIMVEENLRRHGIASALHARYEEEASRIAQAHRTKDLAISQQATVSDSNAPSRAFFSGLGYEILASRTLDDGELIHGFTKAVLLKSRP